MKFVLSAFVFLFASLGMAAPVYYDNSMQPRETLNGLPFISMDFEWQDAGNNQAALNACYAWLTKMKTDLPAKGMIVIDFSTVGANCRNELVSVKNWATNASVTKRVVRGTVFFTVK